MDLKKFVRRGSLDESLRYRAVTRFEEQPPGTILMLLEGRARRKVQLTAKRTLYENYYPVSFIGLEDHLLGRTRSGAAGMYPGSHYVLWDIEDFNSALEIHAELAHRAIFELSRRIRIYDAHSKTTDPDLKREHYVSLGAPEAERADVLYEIGFADEDEFPPHLTEKLAKNFEPGDALMRQGDETMDLFIIVSGEVDVFMKSDPAGEGRKIDSLGAGEMVGEMAQFDGLPRSADVIASQPTRALSFGPEDFYMLFQLHPRWSRKLLQTLAERLDQRRVALETVDLQGYR
ncbi:MAG: cyclic nucleotide-binding domain-containing protein [bacterium]|nr:cyclic nucleotide-binding domain-containing protein [bacterium]